MKKLNIQYTNAQLETIREQGFIYMCACPSQVAEQVARLRNLFAYQQQCIGENKTVLEIKTHEMIAEATSQAHDVMQTCLHDVLVHEKWDLDTLKMPEHLRQVLEKIVLE
jgi:hypothetical protein